MAGPSIHLQGLVTTAYQTKALAIAAVVKSVAADFGFTSAELAKATRATITSFTNTVNYTHSGITPTATFGHSIGPSETHIILGNANIQALQFVQQVAGATVCVTLEA
jgi:hypothetical protein